MTLTDKELHVLYNFLMHIGYIPTENIVLIELIRRMRKEIESKN